MLRLTLACLAALLLGACASAPGPRAAVVVASTVEVPVPARDVVSVYAKWPSEELECMSDCLYSETCQACVERCIE